MLSQAIIEFGKPLQAIEAPTPEPKGTEVLLRIAHSGVCHSDVHIHDGYFDLGGGKHLPLGNLTMPHTLGHEIEGEIVALGPDVEGVKIGEHYAAFPWIGCGVCAACKRGEENLCSDARQLGCSSGVPGGYASHVIVPHPRYLIAFGKTDPALAAACMCSGLTAFAAMKKVGTLGPDDQVMVLGCGGVGMMGLQFARALFGKAPIAADIDEAHLDAARRAGAGMTCNTGDASAAKQLVKDTGGGVYAIVDFVGSEASFAFANKVVRKGGRIIVVGLFGGQVTLPIALFPIKATSIIGSFVGTLKDAQEMMALVRAGKIDPIPYQLRPLDQANRTLDDLRAGNIVGRVVLTP